MTWLTLLAYLFGGAFLMNALPHLASGTMGRPFQSPFAKPSGVGLSSPTVNVLWGLANLIVGYALLCWVGKFDLRDGLTMIALVLGMLSSGLFAARHFGRYHGGGSA